MRMIVYTIQRLCTLGSTVSASCCEAFVEILSLLHQLLARLVITKIHDQGGQNKDRFKTESFAVFGSSHFLRQWLQNHPWILN